MRRVCVGLYVVCKMRICNILECEYKENFLLFGPKIFALVLYPYLPHIPLDCTANTHTQKGEKKESCKMNGLHHLCHKKTLVAVNMKNFPFSCFFCAILLHTEKVWHNIRCYAIENFSGPTKCSSSSLNYRFISNKYLYKKKERRTNKRGREKKTGSNISQWGSEEMAVQ